MKSAMFYYNLSPYFTCQITVIFGKMRDGSVFIHIQYRIMAKHVAKKVLRPQIFALQIHISSHIQTCKLAQSTLEETNSHAYLCTHITRNSKWDDQINHSVSKAKKFLTLFAGITLMYH